jgi:hypothetical protein
MDGDLVVIEPIAVPDVFISGVFPKEDLGNGMVRVTAYTIQTGADGIRYAVIVARTVVHEADMERNLAFLSEDGKAILRRVN